jgi:hypothetical protein
VARLRCTPAHSIPYPPVQFFTPSTTPVGTDRAHRSSCFATL